MTILLPLLGAWIGIRMARKSIIIPKKGIPATHYRMKTMGLDEISRN